MCPYKKLKTLQSTAPICYAKYVNSFRFAPVTMCSAALPLCTQLITSDLPVTHVHCYYCVGMLCFFVYSQMRSNTRHSFHAAHLLLFEFVSVFLFNFLFTFRVLFCTFFTLWQHCAILHHQSMTNDLVTLFFAAFVPYKFWLNCADRGQLGVKRFICWYSERSTGYESRAGVNGVWERDGAQI